MAHNTNNRGDVPSVAIVVRIPTLAAAARLLKDYTSLDTSGFLRTPLGLRFEASQLFQILIKETARQVRTQEGLALKLSELQVHTRNLRKEYNAGTKALGSNIGRVRQREEKEIAAYHQSWEIQEIYQRRDAVERIGPMHEPGPVEARIQPPEAQIQLEMARDSDQDYEPSVTTPSEPVPPSFDEWNDLNEDGDFDL